MFRVRLAALTLVSGLLVTMSGCVSVCAEPMFPRLNAFFTSRSSPRGLPECDCARMAGTPAEHGTQLIGPAPTAIPSTTVPSTQPGVFRVPQASTMPYSPTIINK